MPPYLTVSDDVVSNAAQLAAFLAAVHDTPQLLQPHVFYNAVRRYECCWLPLLAAHDPCHAQHLTPPLDVHWVWYLHMLNPKFYIHDTLRIVQLVPDCSMNMHKTDQREFTLTQKTQSIWKNMFPNEPFNVEYEELVVGGSYHIKSGYDLISGGQREWHFCYQVLLPHYRNRRFLAQALGRYRAFMELRKQQKDKQLIPGCDVGLIWRTHLTSPIAYGTDCENYAGFILDSCLDLPDDTRNIQAEKFTRVMYESTYSPRPLVAPGCKYRGLDQRRQFTAVDCWQLCEERRSLQCLLKVEKITVRYAKMDKELFITHTVKINDNTISSTADSSQKVSACQEKPNEYLMKPDLSVDVTWSDNVETQILVEKKKHWFSVGQKSLFEISFDLTKEIDHRFRTVPRDKETVFSVSQPCGADCYVLIEYSCGPVRNKYQV